MESQTYMEEHCSLACQDHGTIKRRCKCPEGARNIQKVPCGDWCKEYKNEAQSETGA